MRFPYKIVPQNPLHPAFPKDATVWLPILKVRLARPHGTMTPFLEALIDSGAHDTLFRGDIGDAIGLKVEDGIRSKTGGIVQGQEIDVYFHDVDLYVATDRIRIRAGFSRQMSIGALLGRRGFFEHFQINFDPSAAPAGFELQRIGRA